MTTRHIKGFFRIFVVLAVSWLSIFAQAEAEEAKPLRIVMDPNYSPFSIKLSNGDAVGLLPDIWQLWAETNNQKVEFVFRPWQETLTSVVSGENDIHAGLFYSDDRAKELDFTTAVASIPSAIFTHHKKEKITSIDQLPGKTVGVIAKTYQDDFLRKNIPTVKVIGFETSGKLVRALLDRKVDAIVAETPSVQAELVNTGLIGLVDRSEAFLNENVRGAVRHGNKALQEQINIGFDKVEPEKLIAIEQRWLLDAENRYFEKRSRQVNQNKHSFLEKLTPEQRAWLKEQGSLRVGIMTGWPPFSFVDDVGKSKGISVDLFEEINHLLGDKFTQVSGEWKDLLELTKNGEIDALLNITPTPAREPFYEFTTPYLSIPHVIVAKSKGPYYSNEDALKGKVLALEAGFGNVAYFRDNYPDVSITEYPDTSAALEAVSLGKADAYAGNRSVALYLIERDILQGLKVHGKLRKNGSILAIGTPKDKPILRDVLQAALDEIEQQKRAEIVRRYLSIDSDSKAPTTLNLTAEEINWIAQHPVIKVHNEMDWPPFNFNENNTPKGYSISYMDLLADKVGLQVKYVSGPTWSEFLDQMRTGELDVMLNIVETEDRAKFLSFTSPYIENPSVIIVHTKNRNLGTINDLKGKTVAVPKGFFYQEVFEKEYPEIKLLLLTDHLECLKAVAFGKADATIGGAGASGFLIRNNSLFDLVISGEVTEERFHNALRIATGADNEILLSILEKGILAISAEEETALYQEWVAPETQFLHFENKRINLSKQEEKWLSEHKTIRLGDDFFWPPFSFLSEDKSFSGISAGYIHAIEEKLGISFVPQTGHTWTEIVDLLKNRQMDATPAITPTDERGKFLNFSKPFSTFPVVVAARRDARFINSISDLHGQKVGVVGGYITETNLRNDHTEIEVVPFPNLEKGLKALNAGEIIGFVDNLGALSYETNRLGYDDIRIAAPTEYNFDLTIGVRKDWPELIPLINRALESLTPAEHQAIKNQWISVSYEFGIDLKAILTWAVPAGVGACVFIGFVAFSNRRLAKEIAERHKIEKRVRERERWFRALLESMPDATIIVTSGGGIELVNKQAERMFGYNREELIGHMIEMLVPEDMKDAHAKVRKGYVTSPSARAMGLSDTLMGRRKNGEEFPVEISLAPIETEDGVFIAASVRDVTERKIIENALRTSEKRLQDVLDNSGSIVFIKDLEGKYTLTNSEFNRIFNLTKEQAANITDNDIFPAEAAVTVREMDREIIETGELTRFEETVPTNEGIRTYYTSKFPLFDAKGDVYAICGIALDISDRKLAEQELAEKEQTLRIALENMTDGIFMLDDHMNYQMVNERYIEHTDLDTSSVDIGKPVEEVIRIHAERGDYGEGNIQDLIQARLAALGNAEHITRIMRQKSGRILELRKAPIDGGGAVVVSSDITERVRAEEALNNAFNVINGSIQYASGIQRAVLPLDVVLSEMLDQHFTIWEPRDTVGGDIYWCKRWGDGVLLALADCTGHGVPGAFMTLIATGALERGLLDVPPGNCAELLRKMHVDIKLLLSQDHDESFSDDGLEMGACFIPTTKDKITFAGARFSLMEATSDGVLEHKGNKTSMGYRRVENSVTFDNLFIEVKPQQAFYLVSDGVVDQTGGEKGRGFGKRRLKELLEENFTNPMAQQKEIIYDALLTYQGSQMRRDDVTVVGFSIEARLS